MFKSLPYRSYPIFVSVPQFYRRVQHLGGSAARLFRDCGNHAGCLACRKQGCSIKAKKMGPVVFPFLYFGLRNLLCPQERDALSLKGPRYGYLHLSSPGCHATGCKRFDGIGIAQHFLLIHFIKDILA